jgi:hypothetical protein
MQDTAGSIAILVAPEAERDVGWQARAVEQYDRSLPARRRDLRWDLAARVLALTGRRISPEDVYADDSMAVAGVDGATFRLHLHDGLVLVRHCDYCGTDSFESPEIKTRQTSGTRFRPGIRCTRTARSTRRKASRSGEQGAGSTRGQRQWSGDSWMWPERPLGPVACSAARTKRALHRGFYIACPPPT